MVLLQTHDDDTATIGLSIEMVGPWTYTTSIRNREVNRTTAAMI
jgi:hypothetical protein